MTLLEAITKCDGIAFTPTLKEFLEGWFRGVFFYKNDKGCASVLNNTFITQDGKGRILPTLEKHPVNTNLRDLVSLMTSVIANKKPPGSVRLPIELLHFFELCSVPRVPAHFWIDYPYFWNTKERIAFSRRLHMVSKTKKLGSALDDEMKHGAVRGEYEEWWNKLEGRPKQIWEKAENKNDIRCYEKRSDFIQFYNAVYTHVNEDEYRTTDEDQGVWSNSEIEAKLSGSFPFYYIAMFRVICERYNV